MTKRKFKSCRVREKKKTPRIHEDKHSLYNYRGRLVIVKKCYKCPFYDRDSEYGITRCNATIPEHREGAQIRQVVPESEDLELIPAMCPLRKRAVVVRLNRSIV